VSGCEGVYNDLIYFGCEIAPYLYFCDTLVLCVGLVSILLLFSLFCFFCVRDVICNPVVMYVLLSVCNKPRPMTPQAIISLGQADAKPPEDRHLVTTSLLVNKLDYQNAQIANSTSCCKCDSRF